MSVSGYREIIRDGFDLKSLSQLVDFMTVMTFDYHGSWEGVTGHVSPLKGSPGDIVPYYNTVSNLNIIHLLSLLIKQDFLK